MRFRTSSAWTTRTSRSWLIGRNYKLFNYYGAPDAERVIITMGSSAGCIRETVDYLTTKGEKVGFVDVHLYRPFSAKHFFNELPASVKIITVGDRTKEPGAAGEPLYEDVASVIKESGKNIQVLACRFGLGSKDYTPAQVIAQFENMKKSEPMNHYTVGINDDVTHLSLEVGPEVNTVPEGTVSCKLWGLGSDGTVGANKNSIKIIGEHTDMNVQIACDWEGEDLEKNLTAKFKHDAAFFKITGIIPIEQAVEYMKSAILKTYGKKGERVVNMNYAAVDRGVELVRQVEVPASTRS